MTPFTFNPFPGSGIVPLWVTTANPTTASFDLTQLVSMSQGVDSVGNPFLNLNGYGMLHLVGFSDTIGNWSYTAQSGGTTFSFSSSNTALPDGGTTALLLGAGLTGLALISRRQKRKS
jgi:hypothetical protein